MIIAYGSDLHLEFGVKGIIEQIHSLDADVLILAGDITTAKGWKKMNNPDSPQGRGLKHLFAVIANKFKHTFIVLGNHDHYKGRLEEIPDVVRGSLASIADNLHLLHNSTYEYDGVVFAGTPMWTEMANHNPVIRNKIHYGMNDFRVIRHTDNYVKITPSILEQEYIKAKNFILDVCYYKNTTKPLVMITHHSPCSESIMVQHKTSMYNDAYYSRDMEKELLNGNITADIWIHGHVHNKCTYKVANTTIMCNARGYEGHESIADTFAFELECI